MDLRRELGAEVEDGKEPVCAMPTDAEPPDQGPAAGKEARATRVERAGGRGRAERDGQQPRHTGSADHGQESEFYSKGDWKTLQVLSREEEGSDLCFRHILLL